jgi:tRNA:m4X modification enzyme
MTTPTAVSSVTREEVQLLIFKLDRAAPYLPRHVPFQDLASPRDNNPPKHLLQLESIVNHLHQIGLLREKCCFIEFGCGTAKLSDCISEALKGNSSHILIDRQHFRAERLRDGAIKARSFKQQKQQQQQQVQRITVDIADMDLASLVHVSSEMVAVSKHLCGPAADHTIRCLEKYYSTNHCPLVPLAVATCCHYMCRFESFSNCSFFMWLGFSERDFEVLRIISQWASIKLKTTVRSPDHPASNNSTAPNRLPALPTVPLSIQVDYQPLIPSEQFERTFTREQKAKLGKRCKIVLDTARAHRLQELGYSVQLVHYTSRSLENNLLIALP